MTGSPYPVSSSLYAKLAIPPFLSKSVKAVTKSYKEQEDDYVEIVDIKEESVPKGLPDKTRGIGYQISRTEGTSYYS
jgi:hypothetical protein